MRSQSIFNKVAGKRWFSIGLLTVVAALLILVSLRLGHRLPPLPPLKQSTDTNPMAPVDKVEQLSSKTAFFRIKPLANGHEPFYTLNFEPPPPPPPKPTPPPVIEVPKPPAPPPVKKLAVLYQGVYQTAAGENKAFLQVDGKLSILPSGAAIAGDWTIADIGVKSLTITNRSTQTNVLNFNRPTEIEVPIK